MPEDVRMQVYSLLDGGKESDLLQQFANRIYGSGKAMGFPFFLRTGQTSYKHRWERTCRVARDSDVAMHIIDLVEFSECCDIIGLPWHVWAVREMLPTKPLAILPRYGNFPLVPEVRCFVGNGKVKCYHPYWPKRAITEGGCTDPRVIEKSMDSVSFVNKYVSPLNDHWYAIASDVAKAFADDDDFSVDLIPTQTVCDEFDEYNCGWYVTDMALANRSFHWEGCPVPRS